MDNVKFAMKLFITTGQLDVQMYVRHLNHLKSNQLFYNATMYQ